MAGVDGGQPRRVLVVDDERIQLLILTHMLAGAGFTADCAETLAEARGHLAGMHYELLILDLSLQGEDSLSFLHSVVAAGQRPGVMFVSGMDRKVREASLRVASGLGLPVVGTLHKPVDRRELTGLLAARPADAAPDGAAPAARPTGPALAAALDARELFVSYQPKVELATGALVGAEALARWTSPEFGMVPPDVFIPLAEATGLIVRLTDDVLEQALAACAQVRNWAPRCTMAVNLSAICLRDPGLTGRIEDALRRNQLPPGALTMELTESWAATEGPGDAETLTRLRIRGIGLSIDDFGTGHSSLLSLLRLPFSELKIDKSFVLASTGDPEAGKIVRATLALARELGLRTVAEGVETQALADDLLRLGCDIGQGWLFGRPGDPAALQARYGTDPPGMDRLVSCG